MRINKFRQINQHRSRGEVFTHPQLVIEIISKIPKSIYLNKKSMFLVPGCGMGVFMIELIRVLVEQYGYSIEDAKSRVIGIDNRIKYINYLKRKGYRVYHLDFLKDKLPMKEFDVILGNPPFQNNSDSVSESLWIKFVKKSYKMANMVMLITPKTWCNLNDDSFDQELFKIFKSSLKFANTSDYIKELYFKGVGSTFSYYILDKTENSDTFTLQHNENTFNLSYSDIKWIPNHIDLITINILRKTLWSDSEKIDGHFDEITGYRKGGRNIVENGKFKVSNTSAQYSKEKWLYTNQEQYLMNKPKVIYSDSGYNKPYYDAGEINIGHHSRAFFVKNRNEANQLIKFLESNLVKFLIKTVVPTGSSVGFERISKYFPKDYSNINLTKKEKDYIASYVG